AGTSKGQLYSDLWKIVRDENGLPVLYVWQDTDGDGVNDTAVQSGDGFPQPVTADGNLIPLDEEGAPLVEDAVIEVELSRLNLGRAATHTLDRAYDQVRGKLNSAEEVSLDPTGRLVLTVHGVTSTIESPRENLALYFS